MSINRIVLVGRVGQDPEIRSFQNSGRVASLSLATSERWKDKNSGERREKTQWHRISVFSDPIVKVVDGYVRKGSLIGIEGVLEYRQWETEGGEKRKVAEVVVKGFDGKLSLLGDGGGGGSGGERGGGRSEQRSAPSGKRGRSYSDDLDDEIPF